MLLTVRGRLTGRAITFPVQYARDGAELFVVPGEYRRKTWWRNLREPARVHMRLAGQDRSGVAQVFLAESDPDTVARAGDKYRERFRSARAEGAVVIIELDDSAPYREPGL